VAQSQIENQLAVLASEGCMVHPGAFSGQRQRWKTPRRTLWW